LQRLILKRRLGNGLEELSKPELVLTARIRGAYAAYEKLVWVYRLSSRQSTNHLHPSIHPSIIVLMLCRWRLTDILCMPISNAGENETLLNMLYKRVDTY
ncbi:MAG TPA: hypothetical protein VEH06_16885, partial [Candidatus Bathyarchaeia archaeon]|nr:hypothetical protein [Candidatus Bathyarchaeia archaeon]